jgi:methyl-accepting chemotaxis protein
VDATLNLSGTTALVVTGGAVLLALLVSLAMGRTIAAPMRRLAAATRAIAAGEAGTAVPDRGRRDEIGAIAEALETLRGTAGRAFAQGQMLDQLPIAVMNLSPDKDRRVTYANDAARTLLGRVASGPVAEAVGRPLAALVPALAGRDQTLAEAQILRLGEEVVDLRGAAIRDTAGQELGTMLCWQLVTERARLADVFEHEVGAVVEAVAAGADRLRVSAHALTAAAATADAEAVAVADVGSHACADVQAVASAAEAMASGAGAIVRQVTEAAAAAESAVAEARATDRTVAELSEAAARVGAVVRLIGDIAGQTNLLALNATIEAARAGEAGRGFAVVASEVKALAGQTARATEEISSHIQHMQQVAAQSVSAIQHIGTTVEQTSAIAARIAAAMEEQGGATRGIAQSSTQVAEATELVATRIAGIRDAARETGHSAGAMLDDTATLARQAAALREKAAGFLASVRAM